MALVHKATSSPERSQSQEDLSESAQNEDRGDASVTPARCATKADDQPAPSTDEENYPVPPTPVVSPDCRLGYSSHGGSPGATRSAGLYRDEGPYDCPDADSTFSLSQIPRSYVRWYRRKNVLRAMLVSGIVLMIVAVSIAIAGRGGGASPRQSGIQISGVDSVGMPGSPYTNPYYTGNSDTPATPNNGSSETTPASGSLSFGPNDHAQQPSDGASLPAPENPNADEVAANRIEFTGILQELYRQLAINPVALTSTTSTPQSKAISWISGSQSYSSTTQEQLLQRYALATFFFATYQRGNRFIRDPLPWTNAARWLSPLVSTSSGLSFDDGTECSWHGILCNESGQVTQIHLPNAALSGSMPVELALLRNSLTHIDLTNNYIMMDGDEGHRVLSFLTSVQSFLFDDNFLFSSSDGALPRQLANMTSLQRLSLSYNLLQGTLQAEVFAGLSQLTHLEIESNYISGNLAPVSLLPHLTYLYARRNSFSFSLRDLLNGNASSATGYGPISRDISALWIDGSDLTGSTIPSEIGQLQGLTTLSMGNCSLTGTIPMELGSIPDLQRVWLDRNILHGPIPLQLSTLTKLDVLEMYDNDLTGSMPAEICSVIASAPYEFKTLSADCINEVQCETGCCTQCY
jgi:Leucine-rich repeat (LRR) protein